MLLDDPIGELLDLPEQRVGILRHGDLLLPLLDQPGQGASDPGTALGLRGVAVVDVLLRTGHPVSLRPAVVTLSSRPSAPDHTGGHGQVWPDPTEW